MCVQNYHTSNKILRCCWIYSEEVENRSKNIFQNVWKVTNSLSTVQHLCMSKRKPPLRPFVSLHIWRMLKWKIRDHYTNKFLARPCFFKNYKLCRNHFGPSYGFLITVPRFYINSFLLAPLWFNTSNEWNSHTWIYIFLL